MPKTVDEIINDYPVEHYYANIVDRIKVVEQFKSDLCKAILEGLPKKKEGRQECIEHDCCCEDCSRIAGCNETLDDCRNSILKTMGQKEGK